MEVARSPPFLDSTILFSLTSDFDDNLKKELWLCHKNMDISFTELYQMTVYDRKLYIQLHNKDVEKERERYEQMKANRNG